MDMFAKAVLLLIGSAAATSASAADGDWYFGVSAGNAWADVSNEQMTELGGGAMSPAGLNVLSSESSSLDDSDLSWSVFGGFRFTKNFALEVSYVDLGSISYRRQVTGMWIHGTTRPSVSSIAGSGEVTVDTAGVTVKGLAVVPLGERFDAHASLGIFVAKTDVHAVGSAPNVNFRVDSSADDDSQSASFGIGLGYRFYGPWTLSLDWQRYMDVGIDKRTLEQSAVSYPEDDFEADRDAVTLSLLLAF